MTKKINQHLCDIETIIAEIRKELDGQKRPAIEAESIRQRQEWPEAVDDLLIARTDEDLGKRAEGILQLFITDSLQGKRILDYGCGKGHLIERSKGHGAIKAVGFDVVRDAHWETAQFGEFSDTWTEVIDKGPYDYVTIYDVLDHADFPIDCLKMVASVLSTGGTVFVRAHPWCSRHGGHIYEHLNKAYAHLIMPSDVVANMAGANLPVQRVIHPIYEYRNWISQSGLKIKSEDVIHCHVEEYFKKDETIANALKMVWKGSHDKDLASGNNFPDHQLSMQFIDYILTK